MEQTLHRMLHVLVVVAASLGPPAVQAAEAEVGATPRIYALDGASVRFQVRLFGLARIVGQFERLYGRLVSGDDPETGHVQMQIEVSSVNTEDDWRDDYLRGPTFFDAERYPEISFSGYCMDHGESGRKRIVGHLSLHGTTRPLVFEVEPVARGTDAESTGYHARATIRRSEFGLDSLMHIVSDEVEITVAMNTN